MKNKILTTMWLVFAAMASSLVSAADIYNSVDANNTYDQTHDTEIPVGSSARANDIIINFTAADEVVKKASGVDASKIVVRLPDGLNFVSAPEYLVTQATSGVGVSNSVVSALINPSNFTEFESVTTSSVISFLQTSHTFFSFFLSVQLTKIDVIKNNTNRFFIIN